MFHACVNLWAVVRRTPLIGFRSTAPHLLKSGSASAATEERAGPAPAPDSRRRAYAVTSSIDIRPAGPEPWMSCMFTPSSRASLRADGAAGIDAEIGRAHV